MELEKKKMSNDPGINLPLKGHSILLGITGSIAAYKTAELVRILRKNGAEIAVIMTRSATHFMTTETLETLSGNPVELELFPEQKPAGTHHIDLARSAEIMLIAPATANIIGKIASGIADDLLSTVSLAFTGKLFIAPAMNPAMWRHEAVRKNVKILKEMGVRILSPETGETACGECGEGRMADPIKIAEEIIDEFRIARDTVIKGKRVVVTAGGTEEPLDHVRVLTNRSSGKMGIAIAKAAKERGCEVCLIYARIETEVPQYLDKVVKVTTAEEMKKAVLDETAKSDILIMAAAVADYRPKKFQSGKIKKKEENFVLELESTPDILMEIKNVGSDFIKVGFALEVENGDVNAREKLKSKDLDLIVLNNPLLQGSGFGEDSNQVKIFDRNGKSHEFPIMSKYVVGHEILNWISTHFLKGNR
jgi:phosphopantothenoylcysteine decarboxylase/phosphopantothenate--cysteine ligase